MKITKRRLDQIIQEEYNSMLQEQELHVRQSAPRHADAGRLEEQRLNQLIQEEFDKMLLETVEDATSAGFLKTLEKLVKKWGINAVKNSSDPRVRALGQALGAADKTVKASKSAIKADSLSGQYGTTGRPTVGALVSTGPASMQLGLTDICFTRRCRNQKNYRRRMASNARMKAAAARPNRPVEPAVVRIPNEEERTDAWRAQVLDTMGWLSLVPGMQVPAIAASVAGAAMPGIDDAAKKAATEDELTAAAVNVTPKRSPGPDSHRAPVRQRTSGTYLTPERAKEEASFWGG